MPIVKGTVWTLSLVLIALTLLPLVRSAAWWVRIWDFPRLQVAIGLAVLAVAQAATLTLETAGLLLLLATLGSFGWQAWQIYPYTRLRTAQTRAAERPDPANTVRVLIANVLQHNRRAEAFLRRVADADPDIILAVETDAWWDERIRGLRQRYPYAVRHPLENTYGMHLFSRLELSDILVKDRVNPGIPSIFARVRLRSGAPVNFYGIHPEPPQPGNDVEERDAELLLIAEEIAGDKRPTIVCGDLNDVAWSHTTRLFQRISGLLDPRVGRGFYPTFHAELWYARWPLDHIFHDASFRLSHLEVLDYIGSDHFPILAELVHDPMAVREQEAPEAEAADYREAAEKIEEGGVADQVRDLSAKPGTGAE